MPTNSGPLPNITRRPLGSVTPNGTVKLPRQIKTTGDKPPMRKDLRRG